MADKSPSQVTLFSGVASSSQTGLGSSVTLPVMLSGAALQCKVTQAPSTSAFATATLDVWLQHSVDGTTFDDFVHFTQIAGGATAVASQIASWNGTIAASSSLNMHAAASKTLAAGQLRHGPIGRIIRVGYTVANSDVAASSSAYTFSVIAQPYL